MIFSEHTPFEKLPNSDETLKKLLNYNPVHNEYTRKQNIPERNPNETDRAGWRGYDRVYTKYLANKKNENLNILEIGIMEGYGLLAWKRFFNNASIFGVDYHIDERIKNEFRKIEAEFFDFTKIEKHYFDTTKKDSWKILESVDFDIIIDDGGHHPQTQLDTLNNAWELLKSGGLYFIEDIGHRYGEVPLNELSIKLEKMNRQGNTVKIYSHQNLGLKRQIEQRRIIADPDTNCTEYIAVIHKA